MRRVLTRLVVVLVVLLVLAVVADRGASYLAARTVAARLTSSEGLSRPASMDFPDVPFLTQAASGRYGTVDVTMEGLRLTGNLTVDRIDATLHGVSAPTLPLLHREVRTLPADSGEAVAFVSYDSLRTSAQRRLATQIVSLTLTRAAADRISVGATVGTALGSVTVSGQAQLSATHGKVVVRLLPESLTGVPDALRSHVAGLVDLSALVPPMPFGFAPTAVQVDPDGLRVQASGTHLSLPV